VAGERSRRGNAETVDATRALRKMLSRGLLDKVEGQRRRSPAVWRLKANSLKPMGAALPPVEQVCP